MPKSKVRKKKKNRSSSPAPPPVKKEHGPSPTWYVVLMFGLMGVGMIVIILNYMGLTPGETSNFWLVTGLAGIAAGFAMTLNYH
jgi:hypothetical protein